MVSELTSSENLHSKLNQYIEIVPSRNAKEAGILWLENSEGYNVWTHFNVNETQNIYKVIFDINSLPESKLSEQGISCYGAMNHGAHLLERKILNVL